MPDNISFKFILNGIDCLMTGKIELDPGERINTMLILETVTEHLRAAGATSLKRGGEPVKGYAHSVTGATGTHPDDLLPGYKACPDCGKPLGIVVIKAGPKAANPGKKFGKYIHAEPAPECAYDKDKAHPQWVRGDVFEAALGERERERSDKE